MYNECAVLGTFVAKFRKKKVSQATGQKRRE